MASDDSVYRKVYAAKAMQLHRETDPMRKAQLMREIACFTFQQSVLTGKSSQTSVMLLQCKLQTYRDHMMGTSTDTNAPSPMDMLQAECDKLLATAVRPTNPSTTEYIPKNLDKLAGHFNEPLPCQGDFLMCKHDEITDTDVQLLFAKKTSGSTKRTHHIHSNNQTSTNPAHGLGSETSVFARKPCIATTDKPSGSNRTNDDGPNLLKMFYNETASRDSRLRLTKKPVKQPVSKWTELAGNQEETTPPPPPNNIDAFKTGRQELNVQHAKRYGYAARLPEPSFGTSTDHQRNAITGERASVRSKYVPVFQDAPQNQRYNSESPSSSQDVDMQDERLRHIDPKMVELIKSEIMEKQTAVGWNDIAGLEFAKSIIKEAVVWPILRPDIFTGLRQPPRGILLFGPPGTGKTLIGKCIASQSKSTFFSISASSLTSKWIGDGEKMVRALFAVASVHQPAVVFIDEIDSLLCQRSETEHESSRRLKTEFLVQLDGAATNDAERILIVGATNRPQELDEAARRRLVKRLYIPLPELEARVQILHNLLRKTNQTNVSDAQMTEIGRQTDGFSGADMKQLCHEASMGPIRSISMEQMERIDVGDVRPVNYGDFKAAMARVRASVSPDDLLQYVKWDRTYGSGAPSK